MKDSKFKSLKEKSLHNINSKVLNKMKLQKLATHVQKISS